MAREAYHSDPSLQGRDRAWHDRDGQLRSIWHVSNACHVAIVEVDIETGKSTVERYLVAEDAGRLINPMIADGQVHGGIAQGIGNALLEEIVYDESGEILTATLADYLPPTAHEIPVIELHHIETPDAIRSPRPRGSAKAAPSARRPRSSTRSTTR